LKWGQKFFAREMGTGRSVRSDEANEESIFATGSDGGGGIGAEFICSFAGESAQNCFNQSRLSSLKSQNRETLPWQTKSPLAYPTA